MIWRPLSVFPSLHGVLVGRVPPLRRYSGGAKPSCRPSRRTSFPSFGGTFLPSCVFRSRGRPVAYVLAGQGFESPGDPLSSGLFGRSRQDFTRSWGTLLRICPAPGPRPDRCPLASRGNIDAAPIRPKMKAPEWSISRLIHKAFARAVYASPGSLLPRTQDSLRLPARLYRVGFEPTGPDRVVSESRHVSLPPLPGTAYHHGKPACREGLQNSVLPEHAHSKSEDRWPAKLNSEDLTPARANSPPTIQARPSHCRNRGIVLHDGTGDACEYNGWQSSPSDPAFPLEGRP